MALILNTRIKLNFEFIEYDKPRLHENAKRLFLDDTGDEPEWDTAYNVHYRSPEHAARHAKGDGTAFATVALPAHYSAIRGVLEHVKQRLGPSWDVKRVVDWGSGAGSGLWSVQGEKFSGASADTLLQGFISCFPEDSLIRR